MNCQKEDIEALHEVKRLTELPVPDYLGNDVLVIKTDLNAFNLSEWYKRVIGVNATNITSTSQ